MQDYWTEDRVAALKRHWAAGLTASQIARRMGGTTRNAIIGKVSRLGLPRRMDGKPGSRRVYVRPPQQWHQNRHLALSEAQSQSWQGPRKPRQPGRITAGSVPRIKYRPEFPADPIVIHEDIYVAPDQRKGVLDLERHDCRWGIGDPRHADFHFCGARQAPGLPYCEHHARRCYQTADEVDARRLRAMKAA